MIVGTIILMLVILLIRKVFWKKCSPNVTYFLWIFAAFRILIPVNIPLEISGYPLDKIFVMDYDVENELEQSNFGEEDIVISKETEENTQIEDREEIKEYNEDKIYTNLYENDKTDTELQGQEIANDKSEIPILAKFFTMMKNTVQKQPVFQAIWFTGSFLLALYFFVVNRNLFKDTKKNKIGTEGNIDVFEVEGYNCLYGIRKPRIFL